MRLERHVGHKKSGSLRFCAALLVSLILLLGTLAVSPVLHELIHKDANEPGHECGITVFAHGQVDSVSVDVAVIAPPVICATISLNTVSVSSATIENLPFGRGPPASVSSQA